LSPVHRLRAHLTYANVMATIAVFVALGGGAYAASSAFESSSGAIRGCVPKAGGGLRVVKTGKSCPRGYATLTFSARGAQGKPGPQGTQGLRGLQGTSGTNGTNGINGTNATGGGLPTGNAGGDLTGTYPDPTLAAASAPVTITVNSTGTNIWTQESGTGTYGPLQCYEDRAGFVHLQGSVIAPGTGVAVTSGLPSECPPPPFRRAYVIPISTASFSAVDAGNLRVEPTGALLVQDGGANPPPSDVVSFDGVTWRVR
jgi:hypothetical protein